jgi:hypothetical protein
VDHGVSKYRSPIPAALPLCGGAALYRVQLACSWTLSGRARIASPQQSHCRRSGAYAQAGLRYQWANCTPRSFNTGQGSNGNEKSSLTRTTDNPDIERRRCRLVIPYLNDTFRMADRVARNAEEFFRPSTAYAHYARLRLAPLFLASTSKALRPRLASDECQRECGTCSENCALPLQTAALACAPSHSSARGRNASCAFARWFEAPRSLVA